jgi:hypothetical protein
MKNHVLVVGFLLSISFTGAVQAQNKTLGVGVASPNPNAALHVESPTANQGFIMPRLTTAQRTNSAFVSSLSSTDIGLMVFDIDLVQVFTWDGSQWDDTSVSADVTGTGSAGSFSVNNSGNAGAALYATTNGTGPANTSAAILGETATAFSAVTGVATGPGGSNAVSGLSSSSNAFSFGVYGSNSGMGLAGMFQVANASNTSNALEATTNGTGGAAKFKVTNAASVMPAMWAETNSNQPLSAPIFGLNTGTGDVAASFKINNAANTFPALFVETNGTGRGATFLINNPANAQPALFVETNGTGRGAFIRRTSTTGSAPGLYVTSASGHGIWSDHNGTSGWAGLFQNINTANGDAALTGESIGSGASISALKTAGAVGGDAIFASNQIATGRAISAEIYDVTNPEAAIYATTTGTGAAIQGVTSTGFTAVHGRREGATNGNAGLFEITNAANNYSAVQVFNDGTGSAANFEVRNNSSTAPAVFATTSGSGSSFIVNHTGSGGSLATFQNSGSNVARIDKTGQGFFNGGTQNSGADLAEMFDVEGSKNEYEPGDVLVISEDTDRTVEKSDAANSTRVAGVYATKPGVILTEKNLDESLEALVPMGVVGVIPTKVCLENGAIKRGDLLVTSSRKGHAMKAIPANINGILIYPTGAILGKALENFSGSETGLIKVLVNVK